MRSFICSVVVIAAVLIGQQWVVKASEAHGAEPAAASVLLVR
jgi:hypothetical protein